MDFTLFFPGNLNRNLVVGKVSAKAFVINYLGLVNMLIGINAIALNSIAINLSIPTMTIQACKDMVCPITLQAQPGPRVN